MALQASFTEPGLAHDLHTSHEVTILSISLYVLGLGVGPLFVGPLSELYGRNIIYQTSYVLFFAFTWPTAFPPNIGMRHSSLPVAHILIIASGKLSSCSSGS